MKGQSVMHPAEVRPERDRRTTRPRASWYEPLSWLLVRAPLLPVDAYLALQQADVEESNPCEAGWRSTLVGEQGDLALIDPRIRTAIAVASPDLLQALERPARSRRDVARAQSKLLRYLIRMATRPTPYGLFAGVALGEWGDATDLRLGVDPPYTRSRPDSAWLLSFVCELEARPEILKQLELAANPTAFFHAGRVFLAEEIAPARSGVRSGPVSMRATAAVRRALATARRFVPYHDLAAELLSVPGATPQKVDALLTKLWQHTLLLTDLRPPLSVASPARYVAERLARITGAEDDRRRLNAVLDAMERWDERPWDEGEAGYRKLAASVAVGGDAPSPPPIQVDMAWPLEGRALGRLVGEEVARAADLLLRMTPSPVRPAHLLAYRRAFEARYGADREVPLLEMLDPNFGLGSTTRYGHGGMADAGVTLARVAARQNALREIALTALRERSLTVELDEDLVSRLETWTPSPSFAPISMELSVFVLAPSQEAIDRGEFQIVIGPNLGAAAGGRTLGRFADLLGPGAVRSLHEVARAEMAHDPGRLWAEVVYLPHRSRSANVAVRPLVRDHEIAIGTTPSVAPERIIPLNELVVGLHEKGFYVRWPAARAEIVTCAGHMLNTSQAPDVCRFLDDVSREGRAQMGSFDWGAAWDLPFLPRVQAGRIILSPAQWILDARPAAVRRSDSPATPDGDLEAWREAWHVPRYVYLTAGDNRLLLDLEAPDQVAELRAELHRLKQGDRLLLQEALPSPRDAWTAGPHGRFLTELVVPLILNARETREDSARSSVSGPARSAPTMARLRPPGSDWLFAKLYCAPAFERDLIVGPMLDFCEGVRLAGLIDTWFFVRYADPNPHVRLRFRGVPERLLEDLLPHLCTWASGLIEDGTCSSFALDTYEREVERYGGPAAIASAEDVFAADSRCVAELLALVEQQSVLMDLMTLSVLSIDDLLAGLGLSESARLEWYRERVPLGWDAGEEYRNRQRELRALLGDPNELARRPGGEAVANTLHRRRAALAPIRHRLDDLEARGDLGQSRERLYRSHVHLHCNRLAGSDRSIEERALGLLLRTRHGLRRAPVAAVQPSASGVSGR
jgi:thiopeptide-type bacteriocin biosynthesis protein